MALTDLSFSALADAALHRLAAMAEHADEEGLLDAELTGGILTIDLPSGKGFVVNKHGPSKQIWLSSPFSGGLHFSYDEAAQNWVIADGTRLDTLVKAELEMALEAEESS